MGAPHQGSDGVNLAEQILKVASIFLRADDRVLKHLKRDSEWLQQQLGQYGPISGEFVTKFAYETYPTQIALGKAMMVGKARFLLRGTDQSQVVPYASAIIPGIADAEPIAIPADHLKMVKYASREDIGYKKVSGHLKLLAEGAPGTIDAHWVNQDCMREGREIFH